MYQEYFGLAQAPFSIAPDPRYLFMSERHREALAHLLFAVEGGGGFVLVSGEIGAGKTTVCRCFLEQIPSHCNVAYIFNPKLSALELLQTVLQELHIEVEREPTSIKACVDALNHYLLAQHAAGRSTVLVVDEAQNLSADVLEQLRLLTNLETHEKKLLQIILIGQPELRSMLARPELEQLAQRVIARFHLDALSPGETLAYVRHRMGVAGLKGPLPFDDAALARIHALSRGVPRRINLLCDRALLGAYAQQQPRVSRKTLEKAAQEVFDLKAQPGSGLDAAAGNATPWFTPGKVALALLVLGVGAGLWWQTQRPLPAPGTDVVANAVTPQADANPSAQPLPASAVPEAPTPTTSGPKTLSHTLGLDGMLASPPSATLGNFESMQLIVFSTMKQAWYVTNQLWEWGDKQSNPCVQGSTAQWRCFSTERASLAQLRQINRPGLLAIYDAQGRRRYVLLLGLDDESLHLAQLIPVGGIYPGRPSNLLGRWRVSASALAPHWRGEFITPWALPEALQTLPLAGSALPPSDSAQAQALEAVFKEAGVGAGSNATPNLDMQLREFQLLKGLTPDGRLGSATLMQIARLAMPEQPRLLK
jgi:general secretion pathway protein A